MFSTAMSHWYAFERWRFFAGVAIPPSVQASELRTQASHYTEAP